MRMEATREALEFMEGLGWEHPNEPMGHGFIPDAMVEIERWEEVAAAANRIFGYIEPELKNGPSVVRLANALAAIGLNDPNQDNQEVTQ